ncbi:unnamed protein product [Fraxinus pennsylvanica]|uniref:VQ domain-containing protein n=1 Tax=Fraxinus pennsylvanica TaxID=56036 RepID=A0AAD2DWF8_9LAMI|nr:unnamed protein product [Fraxinus pennsylvanica]
MTPSPLKIKNEWHFIKKSPVSRLTSSIANGVAATTSKPQPQHPAIIYTDSPKIIHTNPRDFMTLVQKLTGRSCSKDDDESSKQKSKTGSDENIENPDKDIMNNENDSSNTMGNGQVYSNCYDPSNLCFKSLPNFNQNSTDFLSSSAPLFNYVDSFLMIPSVLSSPLDGTKGI